jgi:hypothetical protein
MCGTFTNPTCAASCPSGITRRAFTVPADGVDFRLVITPYLMRSDTDGSAQVFEGLFSVWCTPWRTSIRAIITRRAF